MMARFEYGGSPEFDSFFLEFLKKKKEGVDILMIVSPYSIPLHSVLFLMEQFLLH
jgi:hypothetical protein